MPPKGSLADRYEQLIPLYEKLVDEVHFALNREIAKEGIKIASLERRVKSKDSFLDKIERKRYENPLEEITDIAGVRVVCLFEIDVEIIGFLIRNLFDVKASESKTELLGFDKMGYQGDHYVVSLGLGPRRFSGPRYDDLVGYKCEIQVRTILQDAWAQLSHHLVYKSEASVPDPVKRKLNNVTSLLEIAQGVFDDAERTREDYANDIEGIQKESLSEFLSQPINRETLAAYSRWKYPDLPISGKAQELLIRDLDHDRYKTLSDLNRVVVEASDAVHLYQKDRPEWFKNGTDFLTKSLGFVDENFRARHPFAQKTREAFVQYGHLVRSK
jgi:putative GTP pyrophosphokinase